MLMMAADEDVGDDTAAGVSEEDSSALDMTDTGAPTEPREETESGDSSEEASGVTEGDAASVPGGKRGKGGCGCQTVTPASSVPWLVALWLCGVRRRQAG